MLSRRFGLLTVCAAATMILLAGCTRMPPAPDEGLLVSASAQLDHALIPALWYTSQADRKRAGPATVALTHAWEDFQQGQAATLATTDMARQRLQDITGRIARANLAVNMNGQLARAHELLEGARRDLRQLRVDAGARYYPDPITRYHALLEKIGRTIERGDFERLSDLLGRADAIWRTVERAPLDPRLYDLSDDEADYIAKMVVQERAALDRLHLAVKSGAGSTGLRQALKGLRGPVADITLTMAGMGSR
jgi:hypothetical protein